MGGAHAHNPWLVLLSIVVAITASYVALDSASRVTTSRYAAARLPRAKRTNARWYWLAGGAVAMGMGIWAMHFIGMLGFRYPTPLSYDVPITFLSLAIAIAASTFALAWVSSGPLGFSKLLFGGHHGGRHRRYALHRHSGHENGAADTLRPAAFRAVDPHRSHRGDRGAVVRVQAAHGDLLLGILEESG